ncbi:polysaccharide lyase 6 family protein, partial [candidate division KSB1 bacterium]|nr:polysaccharide lyase 6 family protein [candidate division KSB1 bacterium]
MKQINIIFLITFLISCITNSRATDYLVSTPVEIKSVMTKAQPGDTLTMKNGVWNNAEIIFQGNGTAENPILLRVEKPGYVILTGNSILRIGGTYLVVDGLRFVGGSPKSGSVIEFRNGSSKLAHHCRLTNCAVVDYNPSSTGKDYKWISLYGTHNRVDHCYLKGKTHLGTTLVVWFPDHPHYHLIDHNYFGFRPPLGQNGGETIRIGTSDYS